MPAYEYKCSTCGVLKEIQVTIKEMEENDPPVCCGNDMDKQLGGCTFELKGGGWTAKSAGYFV
jgi:putative FmdB family regulatory protein